MASVNRVIIIGYLGQDPETRYSPGGDAITNLSVATSEAWKDKNGEKQEHTEWWSVTLFGKIAEVASEYLRKGSLVYIEGRGRTETWEKGGEKKYRFKLIGDRMQMLGSKSDAKPAGEKPAETSAKDYAAASGGGKRPAPAKDKGQSGFEDLEDDIPF